jgi:hypothetical protein
MAISAEKHQLMAKAANNQRKMKMKANRHQWRKIGSGRGGNGGERRNRKRRIVASRPKKAAKYLALKAESG